MGIELATVITSGIIGTCGIVIVAMIKKSNGKQIHYCDQHSGVIANLESMREDITEIKADVKSLLGKNR